MRMDPVAPASCSICTIWGGVAAHDRVVDDDQPLAGDTSEAG
jgi:hypothetical protein